MTNTEQAGYDLVEQIAMDGECPGALILELRAERDDLAELVEGLRGDVAELKQLLGSVLIRLQELGDTEFKLPDPSGKGRA